MSKGCSCRIHPKSILVKGRIQNRDLWCWLHHKGGLFSRPHSERWLGRWSCLQPVAQLKSFCSYLKSFNDLRMTNSFSKETHHHLLLILLLILIFFYLSIGFELDFIYERIVSLSFTYLLLIIIFNHFYNSVLRCLSATSWVDWKFVL